MKAPEKIYVHIKDKPCEITFSEVIEKECLNIEYVRTDAFIEKAMKYLYDYNQNMVKKHGAKAVLGCSEFTINVDEFKKYMED